MRKANHLAKAPDDLQVQAAAPAILVFDGACSLCNGFVRFLIARDPQQKLHFSASQSAFGAAAMRAEGLDPADPSSILLLGGERVLHMSDAAIAAVAGLGGGWRVVGMLRLVPHPLRDAGYRFVAHNRYRWFGEAKTCQASLAANASRIVE